MSRALYLIRLCPGSEYFVLETDGILKYGFRQIKIFAIVILRNPVVAQHNPKALYKLNNSSAHLQRTQDLKCEVRYKKAKIKGYKGEIR